MSADCPSSGLVPGARLLGVVDDDGRVRFLGAPADVPEPLATQLRDDDRASQRLRFTAPCAQAGCSRWQDGGCAIARAIVSPAPEAAPACSLRPTCRWYQQEGAAACGACAWVRTDNRVVA